MENIIQYVQDIGLYAVIMVLILYLGFKYLPKYIEMKLNRSKEKDYMMDSFKSVIENNSKVMENNSKVIESNSVIIKNYTESTNKLEERIDTLMDEVKKMGVDIKILKERR